MKTGGNGRKWWRLWIIEGAHQPPFLRDKINLTAKIHMDTCGVIDREVGDLNRVVSL